MMKVLTASYSGADRPASIMLGNYNDTCCICVNTSELQVKLLQMKRSLQRSNANLQPITANGKCF